MTKPEITSCEEALRLLASHLDGELDRGAHDEVERHLSVCRSCYSRWEFERRLKDSLGQLRREAVPHQVSDRIQQLIRKFSVTSE